MEVLFVAHVRNVTIVAPVRPGAPPAHRPMLRATAAADGLTGPPSGSQGYLSPVLKRLRPTLIPVSDNPAQAKGSKC